MLEQNFIAEKPNQKSAGDIGSIWTREGWLYLARAVAGGLGPMAHHRQLLGPMADNGALLDLHSRRIIGWAVSNRMKRDLAIRALKMAIALRSPPRGCIFHRDRGSQYCSRSPFGSNQWRLQWLTTRRSCANTACKCPLSRMQTSAAGQRMSGKGNCCDNAAVETFFKTIKAELIWRRTWKTRRQAETAFGHSFGPMAVMPSLQYINGFDNPRRRPSALDWKSPVAFERKVA